MRKISRFIFRIIRIIVPKIYWHAWKRFRANQISWFSINRFICNDSVIVINIYYIFNLKKNKMMMIIIMYIMSTTQHISYIKTYFLLPMPQSSFLNKYIEFHFYILVK